MKNEKLGVVVRIFQNAQNLAISRYVLQRTATKSTKIWKARAQPLFCSFKVMLLGWLATTTFRATNVARKVVPLLQVFDGRSKTRNILPQQKNANSCDRALCYTGQLSAQRLLREKLSLRVVPCNITLRVPNDFVVSLSWKWMSFFHLYFFPRDFSPGFSVRFLTVPLLLFFFSRFWRMFFVDWLYFSQKILKI